MQTDLEAKLLVVELGQDLRKALVDICARVETRHKSWPQGGVAEELCRLSTFMISSSDRASETHTGSCSRESLPLASADPDEAVGLLRADGHSSHLMVAQVLEIHLPEIQQQSVVVNGATIPEKHCKSFLEPWSDCITCQELELPRFIGSHHRIHPGI